MRKDSAILGAGLAAILLCGMCCFLALAFMLPFWCAAAGGIVLTGFVAGRVHRNMQAEPLRWYELVILTAGLALVVNRTFHIGDAYGDWDAAGIWNYHARILEDPAHWKNVFRSAQYDHPDYPPGLPASVAFFSHFAGAQGWIYTSFALSLLTTLLIPATIFLENVRRNLVAATAALLLLATDDWFLKRGVSQYADTLLGAVLMLVLILLRRGATRTQLLSGAFFIGCLPWIKNEGTMMAALALVFFGRRMFTKSGWQTNLAALALPLSCVAVFKVFYAPGNDLFLNQKQGLSVLLLDASRYWTIWHFFRGDIISYALWPSIAVGVYLLFCLVRRKLPSTGFFLLCACLLGYWLVYLLTPYDLNWQLQTSLDRLIHQLVPGFVYVVVAGLPAFRLPLRRLKTAES
jgi:hypothetical protein